MSNITFCLDCLSQASIRVASEIDDLGISEGLLYRWRVKYRIDGSLTRGATQDEELKRLRLEDVALRIELDMLKKATAKCFITIEDNKKDSSS